MIHLDPLSASLKTALAAEIRDVRRLIEDIAAVIVADEAFAMAHLDQLQAFDLAIQRADESADLLERMATGASAHVAVDGVRLTLVQDRFRAALGEA